MCEYEINQDFLESLDTNENSGEITLNGCGIVENFDTAFKLLMDLIRDWNSSVILVAYFQTHPHFHHKKFNHQAGFLYTGNITEHPDKIYDLLKQEIILTFYDLSNGGKLNFDVTSCEGNPNAYEVAVTGYGKHADAANAARARNEKIAVLEFNTYYQEK